MCILGNKSDLADRRQVSSEEGLKYAASIGALFFETSALKDEGCSSFPSSFIVGSPLSFLNSLPPNLPSPSPLSS